MLNGQTENLRDLSRECHLSLINQGTNERPPNQGEVFYHIIRNRLLRDTSSEDFWWTRLQSSDQRKEAQRLLLRGDFRLLVERLSGIPALFPDFRTGMIGTILRLKCDNEVIHGFKHILDFFTSLCGTDTDSRERLDHPTIKILEARCPALSKSDQKYLEPFVQRGEIFRHFCPSERDQMWRKLLNYRALIPSFHTFFENLKYLSAIADCLKQLVMPEYRQTVANAFEAAFCGSLSDEHCETETSLEMISTVRRRRYRRAYREIVLHAMRELELLRPGSTLLEDHEERIPSPASSLAFYQFAAHANRLGFRSALVTKILATDTDVAAARQALLGGRAHASTLYTEEELQPYLNEMAALFARFRGPPCSVQEPEMLSSGPGERLYRRYGCPYTDAYMESSRSLSLDYVHQSDPDGFGEPTAFSIRRDIYLSFFGKLDIDDRAAITVDTTLPPHQPGAATMDSAIQPNHDREDHNGLAADLTVYRHQESRFDTVSESVYTVSKC